MKHIKLFEEYTPDETPDKKSKLPAELHELDKTLKSAGYVNTGYDENYDRHNYKNNSDDEIALFPVGNFKKKLTILYYIPDKKLKNYDIEYNSPEDANADLIKKLNNNDL
jgi:hypothetical protein